MNYNKPNRKAPRFRKTVITVLDWRFYRKFKKKYPQYKDIPNKELGQIIASFNGQIQEKVIELRDGVELPEGLGFCFIGTCPPPKKKNVDPKKSLESGQLIKYRNFDSDNKLAKIFYTNYASKYKFPLREVWQLTAVRSFKQRVSEAYKLNWTKYLQIDNFARISRAFTTRKKRDFMESIKYNVPDDYNEFALD